MRGAFFETKPSSAVNLKCSTTLKLLRRHTTNTPPRNDRSDDVVSLLQLYRSTIGPIVDEHGGMVDKFIGDAILIVFGLPNLRSFKEGADRCSVYCAMDILTRLSRNQTFS